MFQHRIKGFLIASSMFFIGCTIGLVCSPVAFAVPASSNGSVLVVTRVSAVAAQTGISKGDLVKMLGTIGIVADVPARLKDDSSISLFIEKACSGKSISAVQIIGGDGIIPQFDIKNQYDDSVDKYVYSDDLYTDFDRDGFCDIPIVRLPTCAPGKASDGYGNILENQYMRAHKPTAQGSNTAVTINGEKVFIQGGDHIARGIDATKKHYMSSPYSLANPVPFDFSAGMVALNLHGASWDARTYYGEDRRTGKLEDVPVVDLGEDAQFSGAIIAACCFSSDIQDYGSVGPFSGESKTAGNSFALGALDNGAQCFIGSTTISWVCGASDKPTGEDYFAPEMYKNMKNGDDTLSAYYKCKSEYFTYANKTYNPLSMKTLYQMEYYGLVPIGYWADGSDDSGGSPQGAGATSLVMDVSGSMSLDSANGIKIDQAKDAAQASVNIVEGVSAQYSEPIRMGVVSFSDEAVEEIPLTDDYGSVAVSIGDLETRDSTNLLDAITQGTEQLDGVVGPKIMILLSDGLDTYGNSDEDIISAAEDAAAKDIKIYTVGFGDPLDLNEVLLQKIADVTNGEYNFADPSQTNSIASEFIRAQIGSTDAVLYEHDGTVNQGETTQPDAFNVPSTSGDLQTVLYWPGSKLEVRLTDPDGKVVDGSYPGFTVREDKIPTQVFVKNAKPGPWKMSVYGADVSQDDEPFYALAAFRESTSVSTESTAATSTNGGGTVADPKDAFIFISIVVLLIGTLIVMRVAHKEKQGGVQ